MPDKSPGPMAMTVESSDSPPTRERVATEKRRGQRAAPSEARAPPIKKGLQLKDRSRSGGTFRAPPISRGYSGVDSPDDIYTSTLYAAQTTRSKKTRGTARARQARAAEAAVVQVEEPMANSVVRVNLGGKMERSMQSRAGGKRYQGKTGVAMGGSKSDPGMLPSVHRTPEEWANLNQNRTEKQDKTRRTKNGQTFGEYAKNASAGPSLHAVGGARMDL
jgi:hypothetical protein